MTKQNFSNSRGQTLIEFSIIMPFLLLIVLGVVDVSYLLFDQHIVTKLSREGSNLISRNTSLQDAATAVKSMSSPPVNFASGSKIIFSVIRNVPTAGASNFGKPILYQRYVYGSVAGASTIVTRGAGSFGSGPDYQANNSDNDTNLQITSLPPNMVATGAMLYVTEIFSPHPHLTPIDKFGVTLPTTLYSIAYF